MRRPTTRRNVREASSGNPVMFEGLESRQLLAGDGLFQPAPVAWRGGVVQNAVTNSWMLQFDGPQSRQVASARAAEIATALGVGVDRIDVTPQGRYARLRVVGAVTEGAADRAMSQFSYLRGVQPERLYSPSLVPNDARYGEQWGHRNIGQAVPSTDGAPATTGLPGADVSAELAWDTTTGSDRIVIAVLDTGVDIRHPDLAANIWTNPDEIPNNGIDDDNNGFADDVNGWDFAAVATGGGAVGQDNDPSDPINKGHGTAVAGVIGAVGGNGIGVAGVSWNVSILPVKVFPDNEEASVGFSIFSAYEYIIALRAQGVNIIAVNASYGALDGDTAFDSGEEALIQELTASGVLLVASAGNESNDNDGPVRGYPASYSNPDIISVAATNNRDQLSGFSNFGRTTVDLGAPGEGILTTDVGGGYTFIQGTSFAAPYTSGVLALMAAANPFANSQTLKAALLNSVDPVASLSGRTLTGGRLNAARAVADAQIAGPVVRTITPGTQAALVSEILVNFSEPIEQTTLNTARIELLRANGGSGFAGNESPFTLDQGQITLSSDRRTLRIGIPGGSLPRDLFRLIIRGDAVRDSEGNFLNGTISGGRDQVYDFSVVAFQGVLEPNDSIATATPLVLNASGGAELAELVLGDGATPTLDVDLFRVFASGPALISAQVTSRSLAGIVRLDTYVRLFDASGIQLAANDNFNGLDGRIQFFVPAAGQYYIGVSSFPNTVYDPNTAGSGSPGQTTGTFGLAVEVVTSATDSATYIPASNSAQAIPDLGTITSVISVPDGRQISGIEVLVNVQHSFVADLRLTLTAPNGQVVTLFNRRGSPGQNLTNTTFVSGSGASLATGAAPFTGRFRAEEALDQLLGRSAAGNWTLTVVDNRPLDAGTLTAWTLTFNLTNNAFGVFELNDTQILATATNIENTGTRTFTAAIGDGAFGLRDVDLYRLTAGAGTTLSVSLATTNTTGPLRTILRLFDAQGNEVRADRRKAVNTNAINFVVVSAGTYYVGVSGGFTGGTVADVGNDNYVLTSAGSGRSTDATGEYSVTITVSGGVSEGSQTIAGDALSLTLNQAGSIGASPDGVTTNGVKLNGTDFFAAGSRLRTFFGAALDGFVFRNTGDRSQVDVPVSIASESDAFNRRLVVSGLYRSLAIRRTFSFGVGDRFAAVDVSLTNTASSPINDLAWLEGLNADPGLVSSGGSTSTLNNVRNLGVGATPKLATSTLGTSGLTLALAAAPSTRYTVTPSFAQSDSVRDPLAVVLNPSDPDPSNADVGSVGDQDMLMAFNIGSLGPGQTASLRFFLLAGETPGAVNTQFSTLIGGTGTGHLVADPKALSLTPESLPFVSYYPEGFANSRASTFLPIVNSQPDGARVVVIARYENTAFAPDVLFDSATDNPTTAGLVPATVRGGVTITNPSLYAGGTAERVAGTFAGRAGVRKDTPFALEIRSSLPVGATMSHYDFNVSTGQSFVSQTSSVWTFAEGQKGPGINDFVVFYNPSGSTIKVSMTVIPENGGTPFTTLSLIGPQRRGGWSIASFTDAQIPQGRFGIRIDADLPIVAALTHFNSNDRSGYSTLGLAGLGATAGATGQGQVGLTASAERVAIFNPGTQSSNVTVTFNFSNASSYRRSIVAPAQRLVQIDVASLPGFPRGQPYGVTYTANRPVTVSLPNQTSIGSSGQTLTGTAWTQWVFGEGFRPLGQTRNAEFLRVYNPGATESTVEIQLSFNDGTSETFRRTVPSRTTANYNLFDFVTGTRATSGTVAGVGTFFGTRVTSATPVVAFVQHFDAFLQGGFGMLGTPLGTSAAIV